MKKNFVAQLYDNLFLDGEGLTWNNLTDSDYQEATWTHLVTTKEDNLLDHD
jgi:hypothetical protein